MKLEQLLTLTRSGWHNRLDDDADNARLEGEEQGDVWDKTFTLVDEVGQRIDIRTTKYRLVKEQP